jgi:hypothetical protein
MGADESSCEQFLAMMPFAVTLGIEIESARSEEVVGTIR